MAADRQQSDEQLRSLNRRLRATWLAGGEAEPQRVAGRALDQDELAFAIAAYRGDVALTPTDS
jgi:hypothetical protein